MNTEQCGLLLRVKCTYALVFLLWNGFGLPLKSKFIIIHRCKHLMTLSSDGVLSIYALKYV